MTEPIDPAPVGGPKKVSYRVLDGANRRTQVSAGKHTRISIKRPRGIKGRLRLQINGQPVPPPIANALARVTLDLADGRRLALDLDPQGGFDLPEIPGPEAITVNLGKKS